MKRNRIAAVTLVAAVVMSCRSEPAFRRLAHARDLSAEMTVQFITAGDASNKAIMAETDQSTATFVADAERARQAVAANLTALEPVLRELGYVPEGELLRTFAGRFEEYQVLDRQILSLATENTNRKAQRLSFGPAQQEADAFRDAIDALAVRAGSGDWHVKALAATAVAAIREIEVLEAPHIAEAGAAAMTSMEQRMAASEGAARNALHALAGEVGGASRPQLATASAALNRFLTIHAEITALSRRNTNVRSLALSLNEKGKIMGACEDSLRALREALSKRGFSATR